MLLDRLQPPIRGVRLVHRDEPTDGPAPFRVQIVPLRPLDVAAVLRLKAQLADTSGPIVTTALGSVEQVPFLEAGFVPRERLHLLRQSLSRTNTHPTTGDHNQPEAKLRTGRRSDLSAVLQIDKESFDTFWAFDRNGLASARKATPTHSYMVAVIGDVVVGYSVTGRSGSASFLQRLGVSPQYRRRGIGGQLIRDSLRWARGRGAYTMLVNTQEINESALRLYQQHGFVLEKDKLCVLEWVR